MTQERKTYEEALAWVDFYKQNKRFVTISRRDLDRLKKAYEKSVGMDTYHQ